MMANKPSSEHDETGSDVLKRNDDGIILHPQPHDDPNDPLNWPIIRKDLCFFIIGFQTFIGGGQTPILAAAFPELQREFQKPLNTISYLVGIFMLALGIGSVFASPTAVLYGKRMVYLLGILIFLVGAIVAATSENYGALMAGRILTGFGASPTESLASASLSELYFLHERAYRTGLYTILLLGGKNIIPLLASLIIGHLGRHWLYWILAIFVGLNLILTFLFVPETFWDRSPTPNQRSIEETKAARHAENYVPPENRPHAYALPSSASIFDHSSISSSMQDASIASVHAPVGLTDHNPQNTETASQQSAPKSFINRLALVSGRHTLDKWWMVALRPFYLYLYPSVLYGSLQYSLAVVWLIVISETISDIFKNPPYGYSAQHFGLFYVGPFVGGILGSLSTSFIGDRIIRLMVKKNDGIYEPEFRLVMLIPATILSCLGLIGYGWSADEEDHWIAIVIFFSCLSFGSSMASTTAITFTVDSYKMFAAEALVSFNFAKNLLGFIFSLFNTDVFEKQGRKTTFVIYGVVQMFLSLCGIFVYVFGKKFRAWTDEKELLRSLYAPVNNVPSHLEHEKHDYSTQGSADLSQR